MTYVIKKEGRQTCLCETKAGAYDWYDSMGRTGVTIEQHFLDTDAPGNICHWVFVADRMTRRTCKDGRMVYHLHYIDSYKV